MTQRRDRARRAAPGSNGATAARERAAASSAAPAVKESTIRLMTRLAVQHGAVNLSQGFPNEPPPPGKPAPAGDNKTPRERELEVMNDKGDATKPGRGMFVQGLSEHTVSRSAVEPRAAAHAQRPWRRSLEAAASPPGRPGSFRRGQAERSLNFCLR